MCAGMCWVHCHALRAQKPSCLVMCLHQDALRPIRYPARIPPAQAALLASTGDELAGLRRQLEGSVAAWVKALRVQVRAWPGAWAQKISG